jgi:hypothetical protein
MWDHRNAVRLNTISPAYRRKITAEFDYGTDGLGHCNHHWFIKPLARILDYDKEHKVQWLESVALA